MSDSCVHARNITTQDVTWQGNHHADLHLPKQLLAKNQAERCFSGCIQSRSSANSRQIYVSTSRLSGADYIAARLCLASDPRYSLHSDLCGSWYVEWGWGSGERDDRVWREGGGSKGGPRVWAYSQWPCVRVWCFTRSRYTFSLFAFWRLCKSRGHGSWSTAHAGYAAVS